jgi:hypothetical protein
MRRLRSLFKKKIVWIIGGIIVFFVAYNKSAKFQEFIATKLPWLAKILPPPAGGGE